MKRLFTAIIFSVILALQMFAQTADETAIKTLFETSYLNGAFNDQDTVSMAKGFYADFAIFSPDGNEIDKYPLNEWIAAINKRKPAAKREWTSNVKAIDITGKSAMAKLELSRNNKLTFTDYFLLLKFESGWKIVNKIYHENGGKAAKVNPEDDKAIRNLLDSTYFNGAFNRLDTAAMATGFHDDFAIFTVGSKDLMGKLPITTWIGNTERRKSAAGFNPESAKMDCQVKSLDITGNSAVVKIELNRANMRPIIDYILLSKFKSGWKMVGKVYGQI
jgi:hypothetical protein